MKLEKLTIQNFMRVPAADIDLGASKLHVFCGSNEAGKSTVSEAIRFALLGDTPRVKLKKDYTQLLTEGGKKGTVALVADGSPISRDVATGKASQDMLANMDASTQTALRLALGAQAFTDLPVDQRRTMLFDVVGLSMTPEEVGKRLKAREIDEAVIKAITPLLRASVDAAQKYCTDQVKQFRANWQAITGEPFGELKAKGWEAPAPAKSPAVAKVKDPAAAQTALNEAEEAANTQAKLVGSLEEGLKLRRQYDVELQRLAAFVEGKPAIEAELEKTRAAIATALADIDQHQEMIARTQQASKVYHCPECNTSLKMNPTGDDLDIAKPDEGDFSDTVSIEDRQQGIRVATKAMTDLRAAEKRDVARLDAVAKSAELTASINEKRAPLATEEKLAAAEEKLTAMRAKIATDKELLREVGAYLQGVKVAEGKTKQAAEAFALWGKWGLAADALAPDGIPAEILSEALDKVNHRLVTSAALAGWEAPIIRDDMEIVRQSDSGSEQLYSMLSVSAKWRATAVIAEVIATMAGMKLLVLDGWDVLDMTGRTQFLKWLRILASDSFDTIITAATLKGSPTEKPAIKEFAVHWVEQGVVS